MSVRKLIKSRNKRKENPKAERSRMKGFLSTMLLTAGLAGCGGSATAPPQDAGPDAQDVPECTLPAGPTLGCNEQAVRATLHIGDMLIVEDFGIRLDEMGPEGPMESATLSFIGLDCAVTNSSDFYAGRTLSVTLNSGGPDEVTFDLTITAFERGASDEESNITLLVSAQGCEDTCRPLGNCEVYPDGYALDFASTVITLGEGENTTIHGLTTDVLEIMEDVGPSDGMTCAISNENVGLEIVHPDRTIIVDLPEGGCERTADGCFSVEVLEITEDVGAAPVGDPCPIANERVRIMVTYPQ
jgi:hypothetical protein